jgi:hypothetical protein
LHTSSVIALHCHTPERRGQAPVTLSLERMITLR